MFPIYQFCIANFFNNCAVFFCIAKVQVDATFPQNGIFDDVMRV